MSRANAGVDRRDTRARNFLFGDRRSVEATLAAWSAWRERGPDGVVSRVVRLALRGEPANLLGTAAGLRAVERLRGEAFGFELRAELARGDASRDVLSAIGARTGPTPVTGIFVVVDAGGRAAESRRVAEAVRAHLEGPASAAQVLVLADVDSPPLRLGQRAGRVERVLCALAAPLMDPLVEGVLAGMIEEAPDDTPVVVTGVGPRVAALALGVGDLFIEYAGAARVLSAAQLAELARRVVVPDALVAQGKARSTVGAALAALGVEVMNPGAGGAKVSGLLVEPEVGPAEPRSPFEVAHAGVV
ncbi:MAG: hypothetical protein IT370_24535 [Deltaproteobacteria bacterium]|nr:hypothetical protein [Deltaproteobacteria bacterium]